MPTISLAMIVKNEARWIGRALASVAPWVSEMVVVDTGSEDESPAIAERSGARVIHHAWDGFSAARNRALSACQSEWILVLDADEELDTLAGKTLSSHVKDKRLTGIVCLQRNYLGRGVQVDVPVVRLFTNDPRIQFSGLLHERVRCGDPAYRQVLSNIVIHHHGAQSSHDPSSVKSRAYEEILRTGVRNGKCSPEDLLYLAIMLRRKGVYSEAIELLQQCLKLSLPSADYSPTLYETLAVCFYETGEVSKAERACKQGLSHTPDFPPLLYNLGLCYWRAGRYKDGRRVAKAAKIAASGYCGHIPIDPEIKAHLADALYVACRGT